MPVPLDQPEHTKSSPHPCVSPLEDWEGIQPGIQPHFVFGLQPSTAAPHIRLVLRVRERGERNPAWCCRYFFRRILWAKITTVKKLPLEAERDHFKNIGITQMGKTHIILGHNSVSESPTCTWYSSAQLRWVMRTTAAVSARQSRTHY